MTSPSADESARAVNAALARSSGLVLAAAAALLVLACGVVEGWQGAVGAALGVVLVVLFFGVDLIVFARTRWGAATSTTVVVLLYVAKLLVFAALVVAVIELVPFHHGSFGIAVVVMALVGSAVTVRAFTRMRVPYVEP